MELYSSAWQFISAFIVYALGAYTMLRMAKRFQLSFAKSMLIYNWHTLWCFVNCWYVLNFGGDALAYYSDAELVDFDFDLELGTSVIVFVSAVLIKLFNLSFLGLYLFFNFFGSLGLMIFYASVIVISRDKSKLIRKLILFIVFLPSISFWSAGIGKDALAFLAVCIALWSSINFRQRYLLMFISICLMLSVRPHVAGLMIIGVVISMILKKEISIKKRVALFLSSSVALLALVPFVLVYTGFSGELNSIGIGEYINERQSYNQEGGGGIDIASMSFPMQMFTYLFRPVIFEIDTIFGFVAAVDNMILLFLFFLAWYMYGGNNVSSNENRIFMWTYVSMSWVLFSVTTSNLGIALRQKWMFVPILVYLLISLCRNRFVVYSDANHLH